MPKYLNDYGKSTNEGSERLAWMKTIISSKGIV